MKKLFSKAKNVAYAATADAASRMSRPTKKICQAFRIMALAICIMLAGTMVTMAASKAIPAYADTAGGSGGSGNGNSATADLGSQLGLGSGDQIGNGNLVSNVVDIIGVIAKFAGVLLAAYGLFKLIMALKDQDSNGITTGVILIAVGAALFMFKTIVNAVFNLDGNTTGNQGP